MKSLRALLGDRLSGGVCAGLAGWFLVLNLFVAAFSCGMTVPVQAGASFVICEPGQPLGAEAPDGAAPFSHDCPYVIGHDGDALAVPAVAPGADLGPAFVVETDLAFAPADDPARFIDPGRLGLSPGPRGPPSLSA